MKGPASGFRQPTFPSIVSASRSLHWCRQCIVADGSGTLSLVRAFSLPSPCRAAALAAEFSRLEGEGRDAGIRSREAGTAAARTGGDAAGNRCLHRPGDEVSAVQNNRPDRQAQRPTAVATTHHKGSILSLGESHRSVPNVC